jgi:hypothetical protein
MVVAGIASRAPAVAPRQVRLHLRAYIRSHRTRS